MAKNLKLWDKGYNEDERIDRFTVGRDRELDMYLAPFDVLGTMAHIRMLETIGLLEKDELKTLTAELKKIYAQTQDGTFKIEDDVEDVHSQVELMLTRSLGDMGKKVHSGRSRNDQVLLDLKLFIRSQIEDIATRVRRLFDTLQCQSEKYKDVLLPGYTHLQVAMPSSFGLWFGAYAESLTDDMRMLLAAWDVSNLNPLGAAAGYGSSFPLDRTMTTRLLGFKDLAYNVVYAQMGRGKTERIVTFALASLAETISRLAYDGCLFTSQNFGFIHLPKQMTTGSSIMPHKKNPDVFELIRAHCNKIQGAPNTIRLISGNLPSGYFRDMQIIKEVFVPLFDEMRDCIDITAYAIENIEVEKDIMKDPRYKYAFSVEEVNRRTLAGTPFRDAYRQVGIEIDKGQFEWSGELHHSHEGSIGNLCTAQIASKMDEVMNGFSFAEVSKAIDELLK
ncbi:MAG: argininosuccinate lyase [Bacteroidales bacterium]|nr:argininosuccinate lyase [Bacteroidales bacterium]